MSTDYNPSPIPTDDIKIPDSLNGLVELLAHNIHENWAAERKKGGWKFGVHRSDEHKLHPSLIAYGDLSEEEKDIDRQMAKETIKVIIKFGFEISARPQGLEY